MCLRKAQACEQCGGWLPAGTWLAMLPGGVECCCNTCIAYIESRDQEAIQSDELESVSPATTPEALRRMARDLDCEADSLHGEAMELEHRAGELRELAQQREREGMYRNAALDGLPFVAA